MVYHTVKGCSAENGMAKIVVGLAYLFLVAGRGRAGWLSADCVKLVPPSVDSATTGVTHCLPPDTESNIFISIL